MYTFKTVVIFATVFLLFHDKTLTICILSNSLVNITNPSVKSLLIITK
ncbi:MAG: hypothetical protein ACLSF9_09780 [Eubacterium sp.]